MTRTRLPKKDRLRIIANAGVRVANRDGVSAINYVSVSDECSPKTNRHTVKFHAGNRTGLVKLILRHATETLSEKAKRNLENMGYSNDRTETEGYAGSAARIADS